MYVTVDCITTHQNFEAVNIMFLTDWKWL